MNKTMDIIKIVIGVEVVVLLGILGLNMLMDLEMKDIELQHWEAVEEEIYE